MSGAWRLATKARSRLLVPVLCATLVASRDANAQAGCPRPHQREVQAGVATAALAGNAALYVYFKRAWWSGQRADDWFVQSDWDHSFRDQDKFGHIYGGYHLARLGADLLTLSCVKETKAVVLAASYAALFQLQIEVWDGYQAEYGFSPPDLLANTTGTLLAVTHRLAPQTQIVKPTISYKRTRALRNAGPGSELRPTVDYSGQTYWLSMNPKHVLPSSLRPAWPALLRVSLGHSITDWVDPATAQELRARRKLVLSLDLDPTALPGNHPVLKRLKHELSFYHLPSPAIEITPRFRGRRWYQ